MLSYYTLLEPELGVCQGSSDNLDSVHGDFYFSVFLKREKSRAKDMRPACVFCTPWRCPQVLAHLESSPRVESPPDPKIYRAVGSLLSAQNQIVPPCKVIILLRRPSHLGLKSTSCCPSTRGNLHFPAP